MSCLAPLYNPVPPREWVRFENPCIFDTSSNYINSNEAYYLAVLRKGNILQYKKNSAGITQAQKYGLIARGNWTNRNTTWATQSQSYSNPNTHSLKRVKYSTITLDGLPTSEPLTCPPFPVEPKSNVLPDTGSGGGSGIVIPPQPIKPGGDGIVIPYPPIPGVIVPPIVIPDGGTLICSIVEDICNPSDKIVTLSDKCNPTSSSDVPGPIISLCYNDGLPTYYPKTKLTYGTSGNKWPVNSKLVRSANAIRAINTFP